MNADIEEIELAGVMYTSYCKSVGGKAFNGDPLPDWDEFSTDPSKKKKSDAWIQTAKVTLDYLSNLQ